MAFVNSNDIYAFPVATRGVGYPLSRLTTEKNITNILNSLTDTEGFVLGSALTPSITSDIEFVIRGYYFKVKISDILTAVSPSDGDTVYGAIQVGTSGSSPTANINQQLNALESTNVLPIDTDDEEVSEEVVTIDINNTSTDDATQFVGISFETENPSESLIYTASIPLFDVTATTENNQTSYSVTIPREYHYKLNQESINLEWNVLSN